jgi:hypothetical protein
MEMYYWNRMELPKFFGMMCGHQFVDTTSGITKSVQPSFVKSWGMEKGLNPDLDLESTTQLIRSV